MAKRQLAHSAPLQGNLLVDGLYEYIVCFALLQVLSAISLTAVQQY
jgi:hypothetical protein